MPYFQNLLQRHVNLHFSSSASSSGDPPRKSAHGAAASSAAASESSKNLRRAGVRLKFRHTVFSARIFDFFDRGVMAGIRHGLAGDNGVVDGVVKFRGRTVAVRTEMDGDEEGPCQMDPGEHVSVPYSQRRKMSTSFKRHFTAML